jgi:hypothetical protein
LGLGPVIHNQIEGFQWARRRSNGSGGPTEPLSVTGRNRSGKA